MDYFIKPQTDCHCLNCNSPIYGRSDKKYCCNECKTSYNNSIRAIRLKMRKNTIRTIEQNYNILKKLLDSKINSAQLKELDALGFNPKYCTFTAGTANQRLYHCYDIRYQISKTRVFNIEYISA